jgi:hypothetical protein
LDLCGEAEVEAVFVDHEGVGFGGAVAPFGVFGAVGAGDFGLGWGEDAEVWVEEEELDAAVVGVVGGVVGGEGEVGAAAVGGELGVLGGCGAAMYSVMRARRVLGPSLASTTKPRVAWKWRRGVSMRASPDASRTASSMRWSSAGPQRAFGCMCSP